MNDDIRQTLADIVAQYGDGVVGDLGRIESLLRDLPAVDSREIEALVGAVRSGVVADLSNAQDMVARDGLMPQFVRRMQENGVVDEAPARWAVEAWAAVLGAGVAPTKATSLGHNRVAQWAEHSAGSSPLVASPALTLVVSQLGSATHRTISAAIAAASPGTRILVGPGIYRESLVVDKPLEIVGDGPRDKISVIASTSTCVRILTGPALIQGLTLRLEVGSSRVQQYAVDVTAGPAQLIDCDITSNSLSCVAIHGASVNPTIRSCRIHDGAQAGIFVYDAGRGVIEDCEISGNMKPGIVIQERANPTIRFCRIHRGISNGINVHTDGKGTIEDCDIWHNSSAGIEIRGRANPTIRSCRIHDGFSSGVYIHTDGLGLIEDCEIWAQKIGVLIKSRADPTITACRIRDVKDDGVFVDDGGRGTLVDCDIWGSAGSGIGIKERGNPVVRSSRIRDCKGNGVFVFEGGRGGIEDCDIWGHALSGIEIKRDGNPTVRTSRIHDCRRSGALIHEEAGGTFDRCQFWGNAPAGIVIGAGCIPTVRSCSIHDCTGHGIYVFEGGRGVIEDCDIWGNAIPGIEVQHGGRPTVRSCRIDIEGSSTAG